MKWHSMTNTKPPHGEAVQVKVKVISSAIWHDKIGWTNLLDAKYEITHWREIPKD